MSLGIDITAFLQAEDSRQATLVTEPSRSRSRSTSLSSQRGESNENEPGPTEANGSTTTANRTHGSRAALSVTQSRKRPAEDLAIIAERTGQRMRLTPNDLKALVRFSKESTII